MAVSRNSARFFWKSLPQEVKDARPELVAVWRIVQCLWNRDHAGVYTAVQGFEWGPDLADFITAFLGIVLFLLFWVARNFPVLVVQCSIEIW